jgi:uncharacterized phage protein (TIGR02218 family)
MKQIPFQLLNTLQKPGRSTCFLVKVVERNTGIAWGFASLDARVPFNDGIHDLVYDPSQELRPQNIQNTADMEVDNTELAGWFTDAIEQRILAGNFNSAEVTIYRVAYLNLSYGAEVIAYGQIGKVEYSASSNGKRKLEYRSLTQLLKQKLNDVYSLTCRNAFGDDKCGMPFVWHSGTIDDVEDNLLRFKINGVAAADGFFDLGMVIFDDGANATFDMEVESWTADGWVTLSFVTPYEITNGTAVRIRQDCDKRAATCKAYGNIVNMNAEHLTPVQDQALMVPGAYVKSQNAL